MMENYKEKYFKYKNKYLQLKNQKAGNFTQLELSSYFTTLMPNIIRRLNIEIRKFESLGYIVELGEPNLNIIYVTHPSSGIRNKIKITEAFPQEKRIINNKLVDIPAIVLLADYFSANIKLIPREQSNILIYCHGKPILKQSDHHAYYSIEKAIKESGIVDPHIYTLDIVENPDLLEDGFDEEFLTRYSSNPLFDIVFMPDCGGPWWNLQTSEFRGFEPLLQIVDKILSIIRPNGKLIISKIVKDGLYEAIMKRYTGNSKPFELVETPSIQAIEITKL